MQGKDAHALVAFVLGNGVLGGGRAKVDDGGAGGVKVVVMPAVHVAGESAEPFEKPNRFRVAYPAPGQDRLAFGLHVYGDVFGCGVAQRGGVDKADVRRINQVFGHVQIVRFQMQRVAVVDLPGGVGEFGHVEHFGRVGAGRVAHPDPDDAVAFLDIGGFGQVGLARHPHAGARTVEGQPVIAALHVVAHALALGQRQQAVRAAILKCDNAAVGFAVHDDVVTKDGKAAQVVVDLGRPRGHVPGISNEFRHVDLLGGVSSAARPRR